MEFQIKGTPALKVHASGLDSALVEFRKICPMMGTITASKIVLISNKEKPKIMALFLSRSKEKHVVSAKLNILAWDEIAGSRFAIIRSPDGTLYRVDTETNFMVSNEHIPTHDELLVLAEKYKNEINKAKILPVESF